MATTKKRSWRLTDRGKIVGLIFITVAALLIVNLFEGTGKASTEAPEGLNHVTLVSSAVGPQTSSRAPQTPCADPVAVTLKRAGFTGRDLREAWAIVMRESGGRADLISNKVDHGLFQFNIDAHRNKYWWSTEMLLTPDYNARVAYLTSQGGKDWLMWGLTGDGKTDARMYPMWDEDKIYRWITEPFQRYFSEFNNLPKSCRR